MIKYTPRIFSYEIKDAEASVRERTQNQLILREIRRYQRAFKEGLSTQNRKNYAATGRPGPAGFHR